MLTMYHLRNVILRKTAKSLNQCLFKINIESKLAKKCLFTPSSLRIDSFLESRKNASRFVSDVDEFRKQMEKNLNDEKGYLIYTDDVKKMIKIASTNEDFVILDKMLIRLNEQSQTLRFDEFKFGPEIIRLYYILNKPVEALNLLNREDTSSMFSSYTCHFLLMNLLYKNGMYEDVLKLFHKWSDQQIESNKHPFNFIILYCAACYKLNTKEALEKGLSIIKSMSASKFQNVPFRSLCLLSMLAFNQNENFIGLELVSSNNHAISINIKARLLTKEKRYQDAINALREFLFSDNPRRISPFITIDTLEFLEKELAGCDQEINARFQKFKQECEAHNFLSKNTLDSLLTSEIQIKKTVTDNTKFRERKQI